MVWIGNVKTSYSIFCTMLPVGLQSLKGIGLGCSQPVSTVSDQTVYEQPRFTFQFIELVCFRCYSFNFVQFIW